MKNLSVIYKYIILVCAAIIFQLPANAQIKLLNLKNGAVVKVNDGSVMKVNGSINLEANSKFNSGSSVILDGDLFSDGAFKIDLNGNIKFVGSGNSTIFGSGEITLTKLILFKQLRADELRLNTSLTATPDGFLKLVSGSFTIVGSYAFLNTFIEKDLSTLEIPQDCAFILNNPNVEVKGQSGDLTLNGELKIKSGKFNVGVNPGDALLYDNPAGDTLMKSQLSVEGGELNIQGRLASNSLVGSSKEVIFEQSGGDINLAIGGVLNSQFPIFEINNSRSIFKSSGGSINIKNPNSNNLVNDFSALCDTAIVSGGLLKIDAANNSEISINSKITLASLEITQSNNSNVILKENDLNLLNDFTVSSTRNNIFDLNSKYLSLGGDWINNSFIDDPVNENGGRVVFSGARNQEVRGTRRSDFDILALNKTDKTLKLNYPTRINKSIRLIGSKSIVDMGSNDITLAANAQIYSDDGLNTSMTSFSANKYLLNSGSGTDPLQGARLIREIDNSSVPPLLIVFPVGSPGVYTPAEIEFARNGATFNTSPSIAVKTVPREHPSVEVQNKSLKKYWSIATSDIDILNNGATATFIYDQSEAAGSEGNYRVLLFAPAYNNPNGYWRIDPGESDDVVDFNVKTFYSQQTDTLDGDWTAGEADVARGVYFSRLDGDYSDPNTWSNQGFDGPPARTAPNKRSDRVRIQNHKILINSNISQAQLISVENGTEGRLSGSLKINGEFAVTGDTFKIEENASLLIGSISGVSAAPAVAGNIRSLIRVFGESATYVFDGNENQISGNGLPNVVKNFIVDKPAGKILVLSKHFAISNALTIKEGILDMGSFTINGDASGKTLEMLSGELIVRASFPSNYNPPTFQAGTVNFDGDGNATIPSSLSVPGVSQYYNLKISGASRAGDITFKNQGEIKIANKFDISSLNFSDDSRRFFSDGSTFRFNMNGAIQDIACEPASPSSNSVFLSYYNLILDGNGTKRLVSSTNSKFTVLHNLSIENNANFDVNNLDLEVQGDWTNLLGTFASGSAELIFNSPVTNFTTTIKSRNVIDNPFNKIRISGLGIVSVGDNLSAKSDIKIESGASLKANSNKISLGGDWNNNNGNFICDASEVEFNGSAIQNIIKSVGNETFYSLTINNPKSVTADKVGGAENGLIILNNLNLNQGNLKSHINTNYRYVQVNNTLTRIGGGFVDGELRKTVAQNAGEARFEVGYNNAYTPLKAVFTGSGGTSGILGAISDSLGVASAPISWADPTPTAILPAGSGISPERHVARQYTVKAPTLSTFNLGSQRTYSLYLDFVNAAEPNGDLRNSADPAQFDVALRTLSNTWVVPFSYGVTPVISQRINSSIVFDGLREFGSFLVGMPSILTYYTRASGNWTDPQNWSQQKYGGVPSSNYPGSLGGLFKAYIGDKDSVYMDVDVSVNSGGGAVIVDSSGALYCNTKKISGAGEFRLNKYGTLGIGDPNGITLSGNSGNIQTANRYFNNSSHNLGKFVYTGIGDQVVGNGLPILPDSVNSLLVNKSSGILTINSSANISIKDTLFIQTGNLNSGSSDIYLKGNFRIGSGAAYIHNNRVFNFVGANREQTVNSASNIDFYSLHINKVGDSSRVKFLPTALGSSNNFNIISSLVFDAGNKAYIDLSSSFTIEGFPNYNQGEWTATLPQGASIARNGEGHIDGEFRKYIPTGALAGAGINFEVGRGVNYRPFALDLNNSGSGQVAGIIGVQQIDTLHPYCVNLTDPMYSYPTERMLKHYWRITKPANSLFSKGGRTMDLTVNYKDPIDIPQGALQFCFDLIYWKGGAQNNWQRLSPPSSGFNNGANATCGERDINNNEATYSPRATTTSTQAFDISNSIDLGNTDLGLSNNNRILLADIAIGQQGPSTIHFYSARDGNWTDPNTWNTGSWNSGVNSTNSFPKERLHIAHIGEGRKVTLNANIGSSYPDTYGTDEFREQRLGGVVVEKTDNGPGYLALGAYVIRASVFELHDGGFLETGNSEGFPSSNSIGNIQQQYISAALSKNYNFGNHNNANLVYKPEGQITATSNNSDLRYCEPLIYNTGANISRIRMSAGNSFGSAIDDYADNSNSTNGFRYFPYKVFHVTAGQSFTFRIDIANTGNPRNYYATLFADQNYDGLFSGNNIATSRVNNSYYVDIVYNVPANTPQGVTQMRMFLRNSSGTPNPCSDETYNNLYGEIEDYTLYISNPNYTPNQKTGDGVPAKISTLKLDAAKPASVLTQNSDIIINNELTLQSGIFNPTNIYLKGNLVNNSSPLALGGGTQGTIIIDSNIRQELRGSQITNFYNLTLRNKNGEFALTQDAGVNGALTFLDDKNLILNGRNLSFGAAANVSSVGGVFSAKRMIKSSGVDAEGAITKKYANGTSATNAFLFPIGVDTIYNPANISIKGNFTNSSSLALKLLAQKHPKRLTENILGKYWNLQANNISSVSATSLRFDYMADDIFGDTSKYIPGRFDNRWEINLGQNPIGKPSPILITNELSLNGDWTVGEPTVYYAGRVFFSRQTGAWNQKLNWSNEIGAGHLGQAASYFPGQLYSDDTVNIDGHIITFDDSLHLSVDSVRIGGTNSVAQVGRLLFGANKKNKVLETRSVFLDNDGGDIDINGDNGSDTLIVKTNLINNSSAGLKLRRDANNSIALKFTGSGNVDISGSGAWVSLGDIILNKNAGLNDTLIVNSQTFAAATNVATNYITILKAGVARLPINVDYYLSSPGKDIDMFSFSGLDVRAGNMRTRQNLITNSQTSILVNGGNLFVGDEKNENLLYRTGSKVRIQKGKIISAGAFAKAQANSTVDFTINALGECLVNTIGNEDADKPGLDISVAASSFTMDGGRIIIANKGGTTPSSADLRINAANGTGMVGGSIQSGDTTLTPDNTTIKLAGSMPLYNLHFANNVSRNIETKISEENFEIKNNWDIDKNHKFNLNGNSVNLGGNLSNYGDFIGAPLTSTTLPWLIAFNGSLDQTIYNDLAPGLELYNLRLKKTAGNLILQASGNSNLIVRNTLEFAVNNNAIINTTASDQRYVEQSPSSVSSPQTLRNGKGHIAGQLYKWIPSGSAINKFYVGGLDANSFRPATLQSYSASNQSGLLGVRFYDLDHPNANEVVDMNTNIQKYWKISKPTLNAFSLAGDGKFDLTLQYIRSLDIRNSANSSFFEQFVYTPGAPSPSVWKSLGSNDKTDSTIQSINNVSLGDFVIGEPAGVTFYSFRSGSWDDMNTWSLSGYESQTTPSRIPNLNTDIVKIGNGKQVIVPNTLTPTIRTLVVEKYNNLPGALQINGNLGYIRGLSFTLDDDCTIGVQHINGISPIADGMRGAIQTNSRTFGVSRYVYNSSFGSQNTGNALPNRIKSLFIDNSSSANNIVFLNTYAGIPSFIVNDTINVRQGVLNTGSRTIDLYSTLVVDSVKNEGRLDVGATRFNFVGGGEKYIDIRNHSGVNLFDLNIDNSILNAFYTLDKKSKVNHIYVANNLNFNGNSLFKLGDSLSLFIQNTATNAITNYSKNSFIVTSKASGAVNLNVSAGNNYVYPIGSIENSSLLYSPIDINTSGSSTSAYLGVRTSWGKSLVKTDGHQGLSGSATSVYLKRYWSIEKSNANYQATIVFHYNDADIAGDESLLVKVAKWKPTFERMPGAWSFPPNILVSATSNSFSNTVIANISDFEGDWSIGSDQAFRRIFYSRISGVWNSDQSWTYDPNHIGAISGIGLFPNSPLDSVVIGAGHAIDLNIDKPLGDGAGVALGLSGADYGRLNCLNNNILNGDHFTMSDNSTLSISSPDGISSLGSNTGSIQTKITRLFSSNANYIYSGANSQIIGSGLPSTIKNLTIKNTGAENDNTVLINRNITVSGDFAMESGKADLATNSVQGSATSKLKILASSYLRIGGTNNFSDAIVGFNDFTGIDESSFVEFYGANQDISIVPTALFDHISKTGLGYGNLIANSGNKNVSLPALIRGNLYVNNGAIFKVSAIDALQVQKSIISNAGIINDGYIDVGK
jgi:hypothetical protein